MVAFALLFAANLLLIGTAIRLIQAHWPDNPVVKATMFAY